MSIVIKNIKRNRLDYILTDILPVEISELFTMRYFYDFLQEKSNRKKLDDGLKEILRLKNNINCNAKLFEKSTSWISIPLSFSISKGNSLTRQLFLLQPIAALQIYYFICCYQDEILFHLSENSFFSLRRHSRSHELYYKQRKKMITHYFSETSKNISRRILEQTGRFFKLIPFSSIVNFTDSDLWHSLNVKYKYFLRIDYKACFDSIYSHSFKWLLSKDVNDSKRFSNTNLFTTIDRVLQNINARSSNGIVVGPEFSRMMAELLLQNIDALVYSELLNRNIHFSQHYEIYRYVDDIFVFTKTEDTREAIIKLYNDFSSKYLLQINEKKLIKEKLPFILTDWLNQANEYATNLNNVIFCNHEEYKQREQAYSSKSYLFKGRTFLGLSSNLKRNFNNLVAKYPDEQRRLVSYVLGALLNQMSSAKFVRKVQIFPLNISNNSIFAFLDYVFYVYSHAPSFDNTQKVLSIINYANDDIDLISKYRHIVQFLIEKHSYVFAKSNMNDIVNLILFCGKNYFEIPYFYEQYLHGEIIKLDDPIISAVYLLYSRYNVDYYKSVRQRLHAHIDEKLHAIRNPKSTLTYREFWWALIFNKSPHIDTCLQKKIDAIISGLPTAASHNDAGETLMEIFIDFLINSKYQFFDWNIEHTDYLKQITYRTHERTLFQRYNANKFTFYSSII